MLYTLGVKVVKDRTQDMINPHTYLTTTPERQLACANFHPFGCGGFFGL